MNLKEFTLKIGYRVNGKYNEESLDSSDVKNGYSGEYFDVRDEGGENAVKIVVNAKTPVKAELAELIYDRYYEQTERFFANGFQSWTSSREYKRTDTQYGLRTLSNLPIARTFSGASGDYAFTEYGKSLYHSFSYTYFRIDEKVELVGSLNERTGYTIFYADYAQNVFARRRFDFGRRIRVVRYCQVPRRVRRRFRRVFCSLSAQKHGQGATSCRLHLVV